MKDATNGKNNATAAILNGADKTAGSEWIQKPLAEWIRKRRKTLDLTQEALAARVGYSAEMLRKIENDERRPSQKAAVLLAQALKIPEDQQDAFLKVARQE